MHKGYFLPSSLFLLLLLFCQTISSQEDYISVRMLTYNIQHGAGTDGVVDLDRQAAVIESADVEVVGLQEVDSCVKRSGYIPEAAVLAQKLGMYSTFGGAIPLTGGKYGVAILSKEPPLTVHHYPLPGTEKRTLLVCEFQEYVFATTHLDLDEEQRLASLPVILEEAASWGDKPFIICGDWNDEPTSTLIKTMKKDGFVMLNYPANPGSTYYTFPAGKPNRIIDYIASYGRVVRSVRRRQVLNEPAASDHRPVLVEVRLNQYTTGITAPEASALGMTDAPEELYDLSGRRVGGLRTTNDGQLTADGGQSPMLSDKLPKGIYILKNKKRKIFVK